MLFSSITFIYYFLPIFLVVYFLVPNKFKNYIILIFSLLFYLLGEPKYLIILILTCIVNYFASKFMVKTKHKKMVLILTLIYDIGQLFIFKYLDFFIENINNIFSSSFSYLYLVMPVGISFFTFQAISYVIDVYKNEEEPANNIFEFITYISLFPQLIAGPIVRYSDIKESLNKREHSYKKISYGISRFIIGLSKKVLLANVLGEISLSFIDTTFLSSWIKPILFTLQIYFDFSGYSDMAIGIGSILGFKFLENFNYPLISSSITEFWRRWHISLSSWFRDYIYIPLGGNRVKFIKWIFNLLIVWFLTGFWHGASWNFIIWGLYFFAILIIEKMFLKKYLDKTKIIKYIYTLVLIFISFLIFNTTSLNDLVDSLKNMFLINKINFTSIETLYYLRSNIIFIIIAIISATPLCSNIISKLKKSKFSIIIDILEPIIYIILLTLCTAFLIDESFNPFLYFRF